MDLEFLEESLTQVLLIFILLDERAPLINALKVFNYANLFSIVHFLIVLNEFVYDFFIHSLS